MPRPPSIPLAPGALPVLGHAVPLLRDALAFTSSLPALGPLARIRLGPFSVVMACDPDVTRQVLLDDRTYDKEGPVIERIREVAGNGLSTCPHSSHRRQRRLCQPSFHNDRFPGYTEVFAATAEASSSAWHTGQHLDVTREMMTLTARATMETIFSGELHADVVDRSIDDTTTLVRGVFRRMLTPPLLSRLPIPFNRRFDEARARLLDVVATIVANRRADPTDHGDLMSSLLGAVDDGATLTDAELADQVLTFFIGGTETAANTLAWALHLLATHPDVQEQVTAEARAADGVRPPPLDGVTGRVLTETLRLFPPAWLFTRTLTADTELGGVELPRGTVVAVSPYLIQHRGDLYRDPDRFDPGRWAGRAPDRSAYLPFGAGARKCIGDRFALTEMVTALHAVLRRWRVEPLSPEPFRPAVEATITARGLTLRVVARDAAPAVGEPSAGAGCPA